MRGPKSSRLLLSKHCAARSLIRQPAAATFPQRGKAFVWCNCGNLNNRQGSALKRGNRGTRSPRCCVRGRKPLQEHQDKQYKETEESLEP